METATKTRRKRGGAGAKKISMTSDELRTLLEHKTFCSSRQIQILINKMGFSNIDSILNNPVFKKDPTDFIDQMVKTIKEIKATSSWENDHLARIYKRPVIMTKETPNSITRREAVVAISQYNDSSISDATKAFNDLVADTLHVRNRTISEGTKREEPLHVLDRLKDKYREEVKQIEIRGAELNNALIVITKEQHKLNKRAEYINNLFKL